MQTNGLRMQTISLGAIPFAFLLCLGYGAMPARGNGKVEVKIDKRVTIDSRPIGPGENRGLLYLERHPDGTIYCGYQAVGLFKSSDEGQTWKKVDLPAARPFHGGFGITRDGRLWFVHQASPEHQPQGNTELVVSHSANGGRTWKSTRVEFGRFAPGGMKDPYKTADVYFCYPNFVERPDGTLMFSCSMRYEDWKDYQQEDQIRPGIRDVMIRSTDGGKTWGDPTIVHQHATETDYAVDPKDPDHILAVTRKQSFLLRGEDEKEVEKLTGQIGGYVWKGTILLESTDGGRTFKEIPGSYTGFYGHRASILWMQNNLVIVTHNTHRSSSSVARISFDGGKTWYDGTPKGTTSMNQSKKFGLHPKNGNTAPTIELSPKHFMTAVGDRNDGRRLKVVFWHIEGGADENHDPGPNITKIGSETILSETAKQEIRWTHYAIQSPQGEIRCFLGEAIEASDKLTGDRSPSTLWIALEGRGYTLSSGPPRDMRAWGNSPRYPLGEMLRGGSKLLVMPIEWPGLYKVADMIRDGEDVFERSNERIRTVVSCAIKQNWANTDRIVLLGSSRFAFLALDATTRIPEVDAVVALKPVIYWPYGTEFKGMDDNPIIKKHDLRNLLDRFPPRRVLLLPAYADTRVGTKLCVEFSERLKEAYRRVGAAGKCKLQLLSIPGHGGDPTEEDKNKMVDWLIEQELVPKHPDD